MRGLTFPGDRQVALVEFDDPMPGPGEMVLEIKASGMCGSDLHAYRRAGGTPASSRKLFQDGPLIAGHEPCGVIAAIGPGVPAAFGREGGRVMVHHYSGCGGCGCCRSGWQQLCQETPLRVYGNNDHGAHAPFMKVPADTVLPLPDALSFVAGAAISCGTGTAYGALRRLAPSGQDTLAIFGQGPVGLSATLLAKAMGLRVIALDMSDARLALARRFGADHVINAGMDAVAAIRELTSGQGADVALDSSGSSAARRAAIQALKVWGKCCLVGEGGDLTVDVSQDLLRRQITVMGSWTFSSVLQLECARFVAERGIDLDSLFSERWTLDQAEQAYRQFDAQSGGKGVFVF